MKYLLVFIFLMALLVDVPSFIFINEVCSEDAKLDKKD